MDPRRFEDRVGWYYGGIWKRRQEAEYDKTTRFNSVRRKRYEKIEAWLYNLNRRGEGGSG
jgi:hypothetical protein